MIMSNSSEPDGGGTLRLLRRTHHHVEPDPLGEELGMLHLSSGVSSLSSGVSSLLVPTGLGGLLRTSHPREAETPGLLDVLDDGIEEGPHVLGEVGRPTIPLVTLEPGKKTEAKEGNHREWKGKGTQSRRSRGRISPAGTRR